MTSSDRSAGEGGFTLLELLIATGLMAALLAVLYAAFFPALRAVSVMDGELEKTRGVSRFLDGFMSEVRSAYFVKDSQAAAFMGDTAFRGGRAESSLEFTAFRYGSGEGGDLRHISYTVAEGAVLSLRKHVRDPYTQNAGEGAFADVVEGIESFEVWYHDCSVWVRHWDAGAAGRLPCAVRAVLKIERKGMVREYSAVARVMAR